MDILGIPDNTSITQAALDMDAGGLAQVIFYDPAVEPASGELGRNGSTLKYRIEDARTNTTLRPFAVAATTTGTPAASIGVGMLFQAESGDEVPSDFGALDFVASDVTAASEDTYASLMLRVAGRALDEKYRFQSTAGDGFAVIFDHAVTADRTFTLPDATTTVVGTDATQTLTNKTIALGSNTVSGTTAQFNTALTDNDFATLAGSETLTNKTVALGSNTISGTTAQFNTALTDNDFATLAGTETLSGKTLTTPTIAATGWSNANHAHAAANSGGTLDAAAIAAGTIATARLGSGTASSSTFLRGDQSWASATGVTSGDIVLRASGTCGTGFTEYTGARGRMIVGVPLSGTLAGTAGTALTDLQNPSVTPTFLGSALATHQHETTTGAANNQYIQGSLGTSAARTTSLTMNVTNVGSTSQVMDLTAGTSGGTPAGTVSAVASNSLAPYIQLLLCQKD